MTRKKIVKEVLSWVRLLAVALAFVFVLNHTVIANAIVISGSMEGTIMTDSRVIGSRLAYVLGEPERFDIILFKFPDDETSPPFVKRIIGLPGEKVEIIGGKVYVDDSGMPLDDSFIKEKAQGNYGPFFVPEGHYFVLGDNRNNSHDSKNWVHTFVSRDQIVSKIVVEYYPTPKLFD